MEILRPTVHISGGNWLLPEDIAKNPPAGSATWTAEENKAFENALAVYDEDTPDRWQKVAAMIPGKTVSDVIKQYTELEADVINIEAGLVPDPVYFASQFTLDWTGGDGGSRGGYNGLKAVSHKRSPSIRPPEHERKKGVPWTEEEHKLFLMGLKKYGKGDWRNISRNYVVTRTPTQVASHAQKYFIRQLSGGKDKRRASIHDITTVNMDDEVSIDNNNKNSNVVMMGQEPILSSSSTWTPRSFIATPSYHHMLHGDSCYGTQNAPFQL